jgi:lipoprotein-anchoring transpeptidase ErfK/SrfK
MSEKKKNRTTRAYYEKYARMSEEAKIRVQVSKDCDGESVTSFGKVAWIREGYNSDPHLNFIALKRFDTFHPYHRGIPKGPRSLAETTCVLKHSLIYDVLGLAPEFTDNEEASEEQL